jgi:uncharacterized surface protein with fasciclin (FAS1) repeats
MPNQSKIKTWISSWMLASVLFFSCTNHMEEYYERPDWLKGNAWEVLSQKGEYTIFLSLVERAGYKILVNGKGIVTVMAPTDEAFKAYLSNKGYASIDDMPADEATKLISYHLVYASYNKEEFANFNPYGSGNANPLEAGLFYKHRTKARNAFTTEWGLNPKTQKYENLTVVHKELYLPVMSSYLFATKGIDATYNYEYFYPGSTWTGANGGFNVSNASVDQYAIVTDNGYVHLVDKVIDPLETIYTSLQNKGDYSDFLTMYDKFSYYWFDENATKDYGSGTDLFVHYHYALPQIASEWPVNNSSGFANTASLSRDAYSVFVPDNGAMQEFFNDYWAQSYASIADVYFLQMGFLLDNHVYSGSIVFPEEIKKGKIKNNYGATVGFDPDTDVEFSQVCVNGAYYGLKSVQVPAVFDCVAGPVFRNSDYTMFLYMLATTGQALSLTSSSIDYTMFIPSDETIVASGYYDLPIMYDNPDPLSVTDDRILVNDGGWREMNTNEMTNFINSHVATELLTIVDGYKVYKTRNNFSYTYVKNSAVASNAMFNEDVAFKPIGAINGNWTNGTPYASDTLLLKTTVAFKSEIGSADEVAYLKDYEEFSKLLTLAGLLPLNQPLDFLTDNYMVFVPSNETILNAPPGTFPSEPEALEKYLRYYFVPTSPNNVSNYPFVGAVVPGEYQTYQEVSQGPVEYSKVQISEDNGKIRLTSGAGQADVISVLPKVYSDGAVYLINGLIQPN